MLLRVSDQHLQPFYYRSPYNYADVIAFAVPLAGSIIQLKDILSENKDGEVYILSFSVLCVLLHLVRFIVPMSQSCPEMNKNANTINYLPLD